MVYLPRFKSEPFVRAVARQINADCWVARKCGRLSLPVSRAEVHQLLVKTVSAPMIHHREVFMCRFFVLLSALLATAAAFAVDATNSVTEIATSGRWLLIEFAAKQQLVYRISSQSSNTKNAYMAFDFAPSDKCEPRAAVVSLVDIPYSSAFDEGVVLMSFKAPGQSESQDLTRTAMSRGDGVAFFQFEKLTAQGLLKSGDRGSLAVWIPGSGDGTVKRSNNTYFSLDGYALAYSGARKRCIDNR